MGLHGEGDRQEESHRHGGGQAGDEPNTMPTATPTISSRMDMGFIIPANAFPIRDKVTISCASF